MACWKILHLVRWFSHIFPLKIYHFDPFCRPGCSHQNSHIYIYIHTYIYNIYIIMFFSWGFLCSSHGNLPFKHPHDPIETDHIKPPDHRLSGRRRSAVLLERSARGKGPVQRAALRDPGHLAGNQGGVEMFGDIQLLAKQNLVDLTTAIPTAWTYSSMSCYL